MPPVSSTCSVSRLDKADAQYAPTQRPSARRRGRREADQDDLTVNRGVHLQVAVAVKVHDHDYDHDHDHDDPFN